MTATAADQTDHPSRTFTRLRAVLEDLGVAAEDITPQALVRDDLDIDSAELVEIVAAVGDGLAPDGKALRGIRTLAELVAHLDTALPGRSA
jgi:acyl carrier protein